LVEDQIKEDIKHHLTNDTAGKKPFGNAFDSLTQLDHLAVTEEL